MAAPAAELEKTPSLAEQWSLQKEDANKNVISGTVEDTTPKVVTEDVKPKEATDNVNPSEVTEDVNPNDTSLEESVTEKSDETTASEETTETTEQEGPEDDQASEEPPVVKLETAPADFRFPTTNQTRHCFTRYIEYHRCTNAKGEGAPECDKFAKYYRSLCPGEWIERWNEQRENGTFPGPL
uniref:Cytochrome c oxidase subunit 6b-1 n=1 Tax=Anthurium amnicola TaxID=1678845 RepID=A0A1D1YTZ3_9ARAE